MREFHSFLFEPSFELGVGETLQKENNAERSVYIKASLGKVNMGLSLLDLHGVHGIFIVADQFVHTKVEKESVHDQRLSSGNEVKVVEKG